MSAIGKESDLCLFGGESRNPQGGQHSYEVWAQQIPQEEVANRPADTRGFVD
jgi:hypothetical protein